MTYPKRDIKARYLVMVKDRKNSRLYTFNVSSITRARECLHMLNYRLDRHTPWTKAMDAYMMENYYKLPASQIARMLRGRGYRTVTKNSVISRHKKLKDLPQWKRNSANTDADYHVVAETRRLNFGAIPTSTPQPSASTRTRTSGTSLSGRAKQEVPSPS